MKNNYLLLTTLFLAGLLLMASSALAGPTFTFGDFDEGTLQLDYKGQFQFLARDNGSGPDGGDSTAEFNFRRNRIGLIGAWGDQVGIYVQTEFLEDNNISPLGVSDGDTSEFQLLDAQLRLKYNSALQARLGKFKYNLTRENLEGCYSPLTLDRSLFIRAPLVDEGTRDKGIAVFGNLLDGKFQYRADVMNGRNDAVSAPDSNFRYSIRGHVSLGDSETAYGYRGTYLGEKKVVTLGAAYQFEPDVAFSDVAGATGAVDYSAWTVDLFAEYPVKDVGTFTLSGAYADYDLDDAYQGADPDPGVINLNGEKNGGYVKGAYLLPKMPLQLFARGESWSFARLNNVFDQEVNFYAGGFNYYLKKTEYFSSADLKLTVEYSMTDFDQEGTTLGVTTEDFNTLVAQIQVMF